MPAYIFDPILTKAEKSGVSPALQKSSMTWFENQAKTISVNPTKLLNSQAARLRRYPTIGSMYVFKYDPKGKKTLPYYDKFPLVIPFDSKRTSGRASMQGKPAFYGLNLHYLPPRLRARLMDGLYDFTTNDKLDESTRIGLSYNILKKVSKLKFFKPCVKQYLFSHMQSRFFYVEPKEWNIALFLNIARFQGASMNEIYKDSRNSV